MSFSGFTVMRASLSFALVLTLAVLPLQSHAQWKWRDAQGRVTVSDRPPPQDVPAKDILRRPPGSDRKTPTPAPAASAASAPTDVAAAAPAKNANVDPELEARKKKAEQEQAAKVKEAEEKQAALMRENCLRARSNLASHESGQRMSRVNEKGELEALDDAQRAADLARTREMVQATCK